MKIDDAINLYRALVERGEYPVLKRNQEEAFEVVIGLKDRADLRQLEAVSAAAKEVSPSVQCIVEGGKLTLS